MSERKNASSKSGDPLPVQEALRAIQRGEDPEAPFQVLFDTYLPNCQTFFLNRGFSKDQAADMAQDVMWSVYTQLKGREIASFSAYLRTAQFNKWKNALRHGSTAQGQAEKHAVTITTSGWRDQEAGMDFEREIEDTGQNPLKKTLDREKVEILNDAVGKLPPRMRQCLLLSSQGLSYREIADLMKITTDTVNKQLQSARKRLQQSLGNLIQALGVWLFGV